jgi:hypothetical protein
MYDYGEGIDQDYATAFHWYSKAAQQGNSMAQANLGNCFFHGKGISIDFDKAYFWLKKAAMQGDPISIFNIGQMHEIGANFSQNNVIALAHYNISNSIKSEFSDTISQKFNALKSKMSSAEVQAAEQEAKKLMHEYGIE